MAQPRQTFDGEDLYPTWSEKAGALLYSLCQNHPFTDGNKRVAFLTARTFLRMNGFDIDVETNEAVEFMLAVASGEVSSQKVAGWIQRMLFEIRQQSVGGL